MEVVVRSYQEICGLNEDTAQLVGQLVCRGGGGGVGVVVVELGSKTAGRMPGVRTNI